MREAAQRNRLLVAAAYIGMGEPSAGANADEQLHKPVLQQAPEEQQSTSEGPKASSTELSMEQRWVGAVTCSELL